MHLLLILCIYSHKWWKNLEDRSVEESQLTILLWPYAVILLALTVCTCAMVLCVGQGGLRAGGGVTSSSWRLSLSAGGHLGWLKIISCECDVNNTNCYKMPACSAIGCTQRKREDGITLHRYVFCSSATNSWYSVVSGIRGFTSSSIVVRVAVSTSPRLLSVTNPNPTATVTVTLTYW